MNIISANSKSQWNAEIDTILKHCLLPQSDSPQRFSCMLTGGQTAKKIYKRCNTKQVFAKRSVDFYFGDERCVPPEDPESNYGMVMKTLFASGIPEGCTARRMIGEQEYLEYASNLYAKKIIIFVCGETNGKVVAGALKQPNNVRGFPICLAVDIPRATMILDQDASEQIL